MGLTLNKLVYFADVFFLFYVLSAAQMSIITITILYFQYLALGWEPM